MGQQSINPAGKTWNYLARFYGVNPRWLAFYNGKPDASLGSPASGKIQIPTAQDLVQLRPAFERHYGVSAQRQPGQLIGLEPPTLTPMSSAVPHAPIAGRTGNQAIVNAARMRRFSHTGDNYARTNNLRSPNPRIWANARWPAEPDRNVHVGSDQWWKCNVLVGDSVYAGGYDWPISSSHAYPQPENFPPWAVGGLLDGKKYAEPIWVSNQFNPSNGYRFVESAEYEPPTWEDLKDALPGDVVALHSSNSGPGHSAVLTAPPRKVTFEKDGETVTRVMLRVVDIYGEHWYDAGGPGAPSGVRGHNVGAVLRPIRRLPGGPAASVGGDAGRSNRYLDAKDDGTFREVLNDEPVLDSTFRMRHLFARNQGVLGETPAAFSPGEAEWLKGMRALAADLVALPEPAKDQASKPFVDALTKPLEARAKEYIDAIAEAVVSDAPGDIAHRDQAVQGIIDSIALLRPIAAKKLEVSCLMARHEAVLRNRPEVSSAGEAAWIDGMKALVDELVALRGEDELTTPTRLLSSLREAAQEHMAAIADGEAAETHAGALEKIVSLVAEVKPIAANELRMRHVFARKAALLADRPVEAAAVEAWLARIRDVAGELKAASETGSVHLRHLKRLASPVIALTREHQAKIMALVAAMPPEQPESPEQVELAERIRVVERLIAAVAELDPRSVRTLKQALKDALAPPPPVEPDSAVMPAVVTESAPTID